DRHSRSLAHSPRVDEPQRHRGTHRESAVAEAISHSMTHALKDDLRSASPSNLELHLRSESEHYRALLSSSHVCEVLDDGLQQKHRQRVQQRDELNAQFRLKG